MDASELARIVDSCCTYREVGRKLGLDHRAAKRLIESMGVDATHFDHGLRSLARVGREYNYLTILDAYAGPDGHWFCRYHCRCGNEGVKRLDGVVSGRVPSCGCVGKVRPSVQGSKNPAFRGCGELRAQRFLEIQRCAERRNLTFSITKEYVWDLFLKQSRCCALSGLPLTFGRVYFPHETTASLDRIDSTVGYIEGNVQWVHKDVNKIKRDLPQDRFLELCRIISSWQSTGHLNTP